MAVIKTEIRLMTFDNLFNALENNLIESKTDRQIVERILEAERDWIVPVSDLNEFIELLEKEIGDKVSKSNLSKLQDRYQINGFKNSAWNAESVYSLLEIFELTDSVDLSSVFNDLSNRMNKK
ncbi:hypothetical protein Q4487_16505 [Cellulophaga sp. 3_MG-2023]|uniref:hypothetical protein n=2 Tax=unclassified Cellulophaga TaxID=2634405 RepID=UPI0026E1E836|nr:hypothetical protein [Cellulophaga sp. 3_MG-2023]MDO6492889.1 hypothetical protein [Cellulophaga sp. 2_MG-2023]MDO6496391.1 hypothetical protein [Cellulophaga sp. 3_MG-2023]